MGAAKRRKKGMGGHVNNMHNPKKPARPTHKKHGGMGEHETKRSAGLGNGRGSLMPGE